MVYTVKEAENGVPESQFKNRHNLRRLFIKNGKIPEDDLPTTAKSQKKMVAKFAAGVVDTGGAP
jgi:hypothetical protein